MKPKEKERRPFWTGAGLACAISLSAIACLCTAFSLTMDFSVAVFCLVYALIGAGCMRTKKGSIILPVVSCALAVLLWLEGTLADAAQGLVYAITRTYDSGYGWGALIWNETAIEADPACMLGAMAAGIILAVTHTVAARKKATTAVISGFLPLTLCCVLTDTVPAEWCLFGLISAQLVLILSNTVRRQNQADGVRLTAILLIPVMLFTGGLFWLMPREEYGAQTQVLQDAMLELMDKIPGVEIIDGFPQWGVTRPVPTEGNSYQAVRKVNLATVGPKNISPGKIMDVIAGQGGILYLRGVGYDVYTGQMWESSDRQGMEGWPVTNTRAVSKVQISTHRAEPILYVPYYVGQGEYLTAMGALMRNPDKRTEYTVVQYEVAYSVNGGGVLTQEQLELYQQLPQTSRDRAQTLLQKIGVPDGADAQTVADAIADYVRTSAEYDLKKTSRMPMEETDFAMWFLEKAEYGYCIHFASAATVLMRAAGIPARYVTGYALEVEADASASVYAGNAHAWVEYFDDAQGAWRILEATPGEGIESLPTEPTLLPTITQPTTEPTETTQPTKPPVTTQPTTEPTETTQSSQHQPTEPVQPQKPEWEPPAWLWMIPVILGGLMAAALLVWGQYRFRKWLRRRWMGRGTPNQQALRRKKVVGRYAGVLGQPVPEELCALADKAMFSQHCLTAEELGEFDRFLKRCDKQIRGFVWWKRLYLRLILAL